MVMTHYMELLSLHEPWFLILFMLVPMVLAETILAAGAFSLLYKDSRSEKWDSLSHVCGLILGVFFIVATVYIVTSYVPTIQWRGPIDYISIWAYVLGVIPAVLILLQELGIIFKGLDTTAKIKKHIVLMILFVLFTHLAMVFGMADPQLAGYVPPKQTSQEQRTQCHELHRFVSITQRDTPADVPPQTIPEELKEKRRIKRKREKSICQTRRERERYNPTGRV